MEKENNYSQVINILSTKLDDVIFQSVFLLEGLKDSGIREAIYERLPPNLRQKNIVNHAVKKEIILLSEDAKTIAEEIDTFYEAMKKGITEPVEGCPFLSEVWFGDTYGVTKGRALGRLILDLDHSYNSLCGNVFLSACAKRVLENEELE